MSCLIAIYVAAFLVSSLVSAFVEQGQFCMELLGLALSLEIQLNLQCLCGATNVNSAILASVFTTDCKTYVNVASLVTAVIRRPLPSWQPTMIPTLYGPFNTIIELELWMR